MLDFKMSDTRCPISRFPFLSAMTQRTSKSELFASLPPVWPHDLREAIRETLRPHGPKLVVLDDDPTGTQTVYDVPVLTTWDVDALAAEFANDLPCFYILTNSRSLTSEAARALNLEIASNLRAAGAKSGRDFTVVSRSDSTLRGHFPIETDALAEGLGPFKATILIPYFEAGGRYTIGDVHYVAEGDDLVPAAQTPFANDPVFGYRTSNLRAYVEEKAGGRIKAASVQSFSIAELRMTSANSEPVRAVTNRLLSLPSKSVCVVNACDPRDLQCFALGTILAEHAGGRFLFRTAGEFVAARLGQEPRHLSNAAFQSATFRERPQSKIGGFIVVGSHVPKTTEQLAHLLADGTVASVEMKVTALLDAASRTGELLRAIGETNRLLAKGRDVVVFTSRQLVTGTDKAKSLDISRLISAALVELVLALKIEPRYLIAKGGITSSDLATRALGVKRAVVLGQILPGVPVWQLGPETRWPGLPFVVFPGNVGDRNALKETVKHLST